MSADNPGAYEPDLARSLSGLGGHLAEVVRSAEALAAVKEAVEIFGRYTAVQPSVLPLLLAMRNWQAVLLDALGRADEAGVVRRWIDDNQAPA
ncbi:hypothetical protein [Embleya sp. NPDC059237]|uniref:hypothetical protein n=1 Tax=Embleya sp. NPDC059237 TaxID=3346784 RepID=UPI00367822F9